MLSACRIVRPMDERSIAPTMKSSKNGPFNRGIVPRAPAGGFEPPTKGLTGRPDLTPIALLLMDTGFTLAWQSASVRAWLHCWLSIGCQDTLNPVINFSIMQT